MIMVLVGSKYIKDYKLIYDVITQYLKPGDANHKIITLDLPGSCNLARLAANELGFMYESYNIEPTIEKSDCELAYGQLVDRFFFDSANVTFQIVRTDIKSSEDTYVDDFDISLNQLEGLLAESAIHHKKYVVEMSEEKVLECSTGGDRRYSAMCALVSIGDIRDTIENIYQNAKIKTSGKVAGKGKTADYMLCPITGDRYDRRQASYLYKVLWLLYFKQNPHLLNYAKEFDDYNDMFRRPLTINCQADVIKDICKNPGKLIDSLDESTWYTNVKHLL